MWHDPQNADCLHQYGKGECKVIFTFGNYTVDIDAVKKAIPEESLASDIKSKKAIDFVKDNAVIADEKATKKTAEKKETAEKAPAKKPAAKKKADDAEKAEKKPAAKKTTKKKADAE